MLVHIAPPHAVAGTARELPQTPPESRELTAPGQRRCELQSRDCPCTGDPKVGHCKCRQRWSLPVLCPTRLCPLCPQEACTWPQLCETVGLEIYSGVNNHTHKQKKKPPAPLPEQAKTERFSAFCSTRFTKRPTLKIYHSNWSSAGTWVLLFTNSDLHTATTA